MPANLGLFNSIDEFTDPSNPRSVMADFFKEYGAPRIETVAYTDEADAKSDGLKVKDIKETYKKDKADNRNRIYEDVQKGEQKASSSTTNPQ